MHISGALVISDSAHCISSGEQAAKEACISSIYCTTATPLGATQRHEKTMHSSLTLALSLWTHKREVVGDASCICSAQRAKTSDSDNTAPPAIVHDCGQQANKSSFSDTNRTRISCMYGLVQASLWWGAARASQEVHADQQPRLRYIWVAQTEKGAPHPPCCPAAEEDVVRLLDTERERVDVARTHQR